ncbi:MAG TPA: RiPP maturation radical SAM C-methyltransferase [Elusimicrobiota bacterium]|nr:RiPP maturation radical SAM C-methyltransferase [Elusimicrobiota bacterium]
MTPRTPTPGRTVLINAPWGAIAHPSIQVGLLKRCLEERGLPCDAAYANLWLLERLSYDDYLEVCEYYSFLGEWLFSGPLFGDLRGPDGLDFWDAFLRCYPDASGRFGAYGGERMRAFRERLVPAFVDDFLSRLDWSKYSVAGFTCTFDQVVPSLVLSRELKRRHPGLKIVFGGSQLDGPMGPAYQRAFPWIDHVVLGEGEESFPSLVERLARGEDGAGLAGVTRRDASGAVVLDAPPRPVADIGRFPVPDYDDYFATLDELCRRTRAVVPRPVLLVETAKGCWWGEKSHCVFCSLNDETIAFRAKSAERVLSELRAQSRRYGSFSFRAVDSIFEKTYFEKLLPELEDLDLDLYFEAKANISLPGLEAMARAGVREFLIGLDSLSTGALKLMRKGGTALQNVQLLKWARRCGIRTEWAILYRCPGETPAMYEEMTALMPKLSHLEPPRSLRELKLFRFSPFHERPADFGIANVRPCALYEYIFPPGAVALDEIAFVFDADWKAAAGARAALPALEAAREAWVRADAAGRTLEYRRGAGFIEIVDARSASGRRDHWVYEGWRAELYDRCDAVRTRSELAALARERGAAPDELSAALDEYVARSLMLEEGGRYLSLAQPPRAAALEPASAARPARREELRR